jgi:hypothetical protein
MDCIEKPYTSELLTSTVRKCVTKMTEPEAEHEAEPETRLGPLVRSMVSGSSRALVDASS